MRVGGGSLNNVFLEGKRYLNPNFTSYKSGPHFVMYATVACELEASETPLYKGQMK